jgi:hypothetical protein
MAAELKRKIYELIGDKCAKYGDSYDKGSAFFTKAHRLIDQLFVIDSP